MNGILNEDFLTRIGAKEFSSYEKFREAMKLLGDKPLNRFPMYHLPDKKPIIHVDSELGDIELVGIYYYHNHGLEIEMQTIPKMKDGTPTMTKYIAYFEKTPLGHKLSQIDEWRYEGSSRPDRKWFYDDHPIFEDTTQCRVFPALEKIIQS